MIYCINDINSIDEKKRKKRKMFTFVTVRSPNVTVTVKSSI